mmetsp:Transcript_25843/g.34559  ORF Transcript_25843/g.34559 Transcript_25843/m.34559 type:complete len:213 (+) Transcript_25843:929-1567(+)|eukprot:CAMPEP_0185598832 /NCGR_PEP_ID=MMETSP0434-20130131/82272_1 /TAXON_ID=626734 ORGANISM="Favella taraikaensis, Strain Fe Narragansett Bay" /NCGR_SAMPLE_ID=MMETSP0434 /ASSEMBLY_ACC=CAM_ASM_000379 /LENGTH=212 /DNA_ID=CAMNT_0028227975 /DNA_START=854 /DNA_END=1492 /DNA_ORIENTATION=+
MHVQKRVRYTYWDVLGDVGGFHDGLLLLLGLVMGPASANHFQNDLVSGGLRDSARSMELKRKSRMVAKQLNESRDGREQDSDSDAKGLIRQTLIDFNKHLERVKISLRENISNFFCRCVRKHKGVRSVQRLADFKTAQLDITRIISNSISLRDFFRFFLTRQQKALLARQRTRVATLNGNSDSASCVSKCKDEDDPFVEVDDREFAAALEDY